MVVSVSHLSKYYQVHQKEPGFIGSLKSLLARHYETVKAIDDISFEISEGELVGFIGPNGAGKTTTLKCLSGLLYPTNGRISVLGFTPFQRKKEFLKKIALVMGQKNQLWWDLPAVDTFALNKEIYEVPQKQFDQTLFELARLLDVKDLLNVAVRKLSLGQRMKMELIAALIHSPKVLFLDEPTIGLDVVMQQKLREFIKEYNSRYKATIILTSHYMGDVEALCKRVIIINSGRILYDGLLLELVKKYAPYKTITVVFRDYVDPKKLADFGEIKNFDHPKLELRVSSKQVGKITSEILEQFEIEDLTIEEPEIEDVIREVFSKKE
ncbi:MAG: ATP-binding cassette domain-containing protein [Candidatus Levybacteria bacterium]|nr:ATP-binding cassette domain-containing protein [Candidatus Levybacteria bacterium]MBI3069945.1 ATP-binding cassette domain-containing protein [Candidatus Levybacteria bacterium]